MSRKLITYGLLFVTLFWLVASYLPAHILTLPKASLDGIISSPIQRLLFIAIMVLFVGIQVSLVVSTNRLFPNAKSPEDQAERDTEDGLSKAEQFGLKRGSELVWTSVPVAMTLITLLLAFTVFA